MQPKRNLTRRGFVQGTLATGLASGGFLSTERALGFQSPNERPVFATIGLRNQGVTITNNNLKPGQLTGSQRLLRLAHRDLISYA